MNTYEQEAKRILEALLFSSNTPLPLDKIHTVLTNFRPFPAHSVKKLMDELRSEYNERSHAFQLDEVSEGYVLRTRPIYRPYIEELQGAKRRDRLSTQALEVLAIIYHKQPVTRMTIDAIRGVDSSNVLQTLMERALIDQTGRQEGAGRPALYSVTKEFCYLFNKPLPQSRE